MQGPRAEAVLFSAANPENEADEAGSIRPLGTLLYIGQAQKLSPAWTCHWLFLRGVPFSLFQSYSALMKTVELRT